MKPLEALGYLTAKYNLDKEYPEHYEALSKALNRLEKLETFKKTTDISFKQKGFAERIARDLEIKDFDITQYNKKTIGEFIDGHINAWKEKKGYSTEETEVKDSEIPF